MTTKEETKDTYQPGRAIMTADELAQHHVSRSGRDYRLSDDGYGDMDVAAKEGWHSVSGWGRDGWDLGDWPYVVISVRNRRHPGYVLDGLHVPVVTGAKTHSPPWSTSSAKQSRETRTFTASTRSRTGPQLSTSSSFGTGWAVTTTAGAMRA